ncbi:MAG TPA: hypothetical protein VLV31_07330, partial [Candidatus Acidoferrales bacterium]|nr:hypothetical protein [Candidatus Acidoferrales bacterium]
PTEHPETGPATTPAMIVRNAVGLTLGGPPASARRSTAFAADIDAINATDLVLLVKFLNFLVDYRINLL